MNALYQNPYTDAWRALAQKIPKPKAILCISAHWYMPGTAVTFDQQPRTIHDFGGFPKELYQVQYPAPGDRELALSVQNILAPLNVALDQNWGLDHGTWSVLCHVYPEADVPVVQLSIDETKPAAFHFEIGRKLSSFRDQDILILGSGNIVHNLHTYAWGRHVPEPYDWAVRFEKTARELMMAGNFMPLIDYENFGKDAILSIPTPDHYLPLLYVLGTHQQGERVSFPVEGVDGGSISMLAVQLGV
jgi:4,5-DOPA dioxygenase extradiol